MLSIIVDGREVALDPTKDRLLVGRGAGSDIVLDAPNISRTHLVLERRGDRWFAVDQGSANGTTHRGQRVSELAIDGETQLLLGGAGHVTIDLRVAAPPSAEMPTVSFAPAAAPPPAAPSAPPVAFEPPAVGTAPSPAAAQLPPRPPTSLPPTPAAPNPPPPTKPSQRGRNLALAGLAVLALGGMGLIALGLTGGDSEPAAVSVATTADLSAPATPFSPTSVPAASAAPTAPPATEPAAPETYPRVLGGMTIAARCDNLGGYDDVPNLQVVVRDVDENFLITMERSVLDPSPTDDGGCLVVYQGDDLPKLDQYLVDLGRRGELFIEAADFLDEDGDGTTLIFAFTLG